MMMRLQLKKLADIFEMIFFSITLQFPNATDLGKTFIIATDNSVGILFYPFPEKSDL